MPRAAREVIGGAKLTGCWRHWQFVTGVSFDRAVGESASETIALPERSSRRTVLRTTAGDGLLVEDDEEVETDGRQVSVDGLGCSTPLLQRRSQSLVIAPQAGRFDIDHLRIRIGEADQLDRVGRLEIMQHHVHSFSLAERPLRL